MVLVAHVKLCSADCADPARLTSTTYFLVCPPGAVTVMVMRVTVPAVRLMPRVLNPCSSVTVLAGCTLSSSYVIVASSCEADAVSLMDATVLGTATA